MGQDLVGELQQGWGLDQGNQSELETLLIKMQKNTLVKDHEWFNLTIEGTNFT